MNQDQITNRDCSTGVAALIKREACQTVIVGGLFPAIADIGHPQAQTLCP
jgi:hypothetical protein